MTFRAAVFIIEKRPRIGGTDLQALKSNSAVLARLLALAEPGYRDFTAKLLPTLDPERILGVRTPALRALARALRGSTEAEDFLASLPHAYQEENLLHAFLLADEKDYARCLERVEAFLPQVDNWAVCDQLSLPCFRRHRQ